MTEEPELTGAELERESAEPLPDREAMSTLNPDPTAIDLEPNPPAWLQPGDKPGDGLEPLRGGEDL
jgi:hypothetical protein